jgi:hypothetical protein
MFLLWMLQAATLLPPTPAVPAPPLESRASAEVAAHYESRLVELVQLPEVQWQELEALRPDKYHQTQTLISLLKNGNRRQAKLAALLGAGTTDLELQHALYVAACTRKDEATALACLLAPAEMNYPQIAAMAYLAQSQKQPLSVRAAAAGRLLENGYLSVWPLCRSIFRSGTAGDERPPWANWKRGVRWELPKRILLLSLNRWLAKNELGASTIEPNAAWEVQLKQLAATELLVQKSRKGVAVDPLRSWNHSSGPGDVVPPARPRFDRLFDLAMEGDRQAEWAIQWIRPQTHTLFQRELGSPHLTRQQMARRIVENTPK